MSDLSKIMLSDEEQQLVNNPGWILTKRIIMDKANAMLGNLYEGQKSVIAKESGWLPAVVIQSIPKIAKGENYLGLPYLVLDHPRCFDGENIFAVRTMFWWGNFFSVTMQLSGIYKEMFGEKIQEYLLQKENDLFICIHESQWEHHFEAGNYVAVKQLPGNELQSIIAEKQFIKLAVKFSLQQWSNMPALLEHSFKEMISLLN